MMNHRYAFASTVLGIFVVIKVFLYRFSGSYLYVIGGRKLGDD